MSNLTDSDASSDKTFDEDSAADHSEADGDVRDITNKSNPKTEKTSNHYKHIYPVHHQVRTSCLSRESKVPLSFVGFKHLMVLMLCRLLLNRFEFKPSLTYWQQLFPT